MNDRLDFTAIILVISFAMASQKVDWEWRVRLPPGPPSQATVIVLSPPAQEDGFLRKEPRPDTNDLGLWVLFLDGRVEGPMTFKVTAYNEHDGHTPGTITASGLPVMAEITAACGPELEFGAVIVLENGMIVRCLDRGGGIGEGELDIYLADLSEAERFGVQEIKGVIVR